MGYPVDGRLHSACTAGLHGFPWIIQPEVAPLYKEVGDMEIIVLDERDAPTELRIHRISIDALHGTLAGLIRRVGFARKYDLDRAPGSIEDACQPLRVPKDQFRALVFGESPGVSDGEYRGVQQSTSS